MPWSGFMYGEFKRRKSILELHFSILIPLVVTDSIRHERRPSFGSHFGHFQLDNY